MLHPLLLLDLVLKCLPNLGLVLAVQGCYNFWRWLRTARIAFVALDVRSLALLENPCSPICTPLERLRMLEVCNRFASGFSPVSELRL